MSMIRDPRQKSIGPVSQIKASAVVDRKEHAEEERRYKKRMDDVVKREHRLKHRQAAGRVARGLFPRTRVREAFSEAQEERKRGKSHAISKTERLMRSLREGSLRHPSTCHCPRCQTVKTKKVLSGASSRSYMANPLYSPRVAKRARLI